MWKLPSECEVMWILSYLWFSISDLELSAVCEKLQEKVNLSLYLQFSPCHIWSCFLLYVKSYKKRRISPHTCGCPCQIWKLLSPVYVNIGYLVLVVLPFQICCFFLPVCEKLQEEWIFHMCSSPCQIWSFFSVCEYLVFVVFHFRSVASSVLYVKRCKSESLIHTCGFFHFTFEASSCMWKTANMISDMVHCSVWFVFHYSLFVFWSMKERNQTLWVLQISLLKFVWFDWKFWFCEILLNNQQEHKICLLKLYSMIQGLRVWQDMIGCDNVCLEHFRGK